MRKLLTLLPLLVAFQAKGISLLSIDASRHYLTNGSGQAVLLVGPHTWSTQQPGNYAWTNSWPSYLTLLATNGCNFTGAWLTDCASDNGGTTLVSPMPWNRSGGGSATHGGAKFDLMDFNATFFQSLSNNMTQAGSSNVYVKLYLTDGWRAIGESSAWTWSALYGGNNINSTTTTLGDLWTMNHSATVNMIDAFVTNVLQWVKNCPNVILMVSNEGPTYTTNWQNHIYGVITNKEAQLGVRHVVGTGSLYNSGTDKINPNLAAMTLDTYEPNGTDPNDAVNSALYVTSPPIITGAAKPVGIDTDHMNWQGFAGTVGVDYVFKVCLRGYSWLVYMDAADSTVFPLTPNYAMMRAMGDVAGYMNGRMDLKNCSPSTTLASTTYCLANAGVEYLVYQPSTDTFTITLPQRKVYTVEWFDTNRRTTRTASNVVGTGATQNFTPPNDYARSLCYIKVTSGVPFVQSLTVTGSMKATTVNHATQ